MMIEMVQTYIRAEMDTIEYMYQGYEDGQS